MVYACPDKSGHFEDIKASTICINAMKSSVIKCKTVSRKNKLPGTVYSTSESLAIGHTRKTL